MSQSYVKNASSTARSAVLAALLGVAAVVAVFVTERLAFERQYAAVAERTRQATELGGEIFLLDERLTNVARLMAATGSLDRMSQYEADAKRIYEALKEVEGLVPPAAAKRFRDEASFANDRLIAIGARAFEEIANGNAEKAQSFLSSPVYESNKAILNRGIERFIASLGIRSESELKVVATRSRQIMLAIAALSVIAGLLVWIRLNRSLRQSEHAFGKAEDEIKSLALNDTLTGLANRRAFQAELGRSIARVERSGRKLALMIMDLDKFKPINDRYGHPAGDALLKEIGRRLQTTTRSGELVARLGGDEFVALVEFGDDAETPLIAAERFMGHMAEPVDWEGLRLEVGASVGAAFFPMDASEPDELLRKADIALYSCKQDGRGRIRAFDSTMDDVLQRRGWIEDELRTALAAQAIVPFYQPIVALSTGHLRSLEVLARWHHPEKGLISPSDFIPVAETSGLITDITYVMLRRACRDAIAIRVPLSVNVSPKTLLDPFFVARVMAILTDTGFDPTRLEIEITENVLVADIENARRVIRDLKTQGISLALDDFGSGYSSLGYLSELPFDKLKIDKSFVLSMATRNESAKIVRSVVSLGRSLNLAVVAEGVETPETAATLRALGCDYAQGYLYAKPLPVSDIGAVIDRLAPRRTAA